KGKLNDINGQYIAYSNTSFSVFNGTFIDHKLDGTIEVFIYENNDPETSQEQEEEGNGPDKDNGRRHIYNSRNEIPL
ncbi:hypothetical protein, partial [Enterococcus faecium]|uniref:hypothetical protein n=1 Tax=Enterococcus faecium TaxID=1352 RepID=UPI003DA111B0